MLSYEQVVGCCCELAKQSPSSCCTDVNLNACSSPHTSQGTARKSEGLEPTMCIASRECMPP